MFPDHKPADTDFINAVTNGMYSSNYYCFFNSLIVIKYKSG